MLAFEKKLAVLKVLKRLVHEEDGLEMVEWSVIAALITTVGALTFQLLGLRVGASLLNLQILTTP